MRKSREGLVALLDALVFLAAASVVSVSLLASFGGQSASLHADIQDYVDRAHNVLLRTTYRTAAADLCPGDNNKTGTILEASISEIVRAKGSGSQFSGDLAATISNILDCLLPSDVYRYTWRIELGGSSFSSSNCVQSMFDDASEKYVSRMSYPVPTEGGEAVVSLTVILSTL